MCCCFNTNHAMGRCSSRQTDVIFLLFFSLSQKIGFNRGDSLHEMLKWRILFSGENKEIIPKCCLLKCLPNMLKVYTKKKSLMRVMSSYCIRIAKVKLNLCIRTVSSGFSLDCSCLFMYSTSSVNISGQRS